MVVRLLHAPSSRSTTRRLADRTVAGRRSSIASLLRRQRLKVRMCVLDSRLAVLDGRDLRFGARAALLLRLGEERRQGRDLCLDLRLGACTQR